MFGRGWGSLCDRRWRHGTAALLVSAALPGTALAQAEGDGFLGTIVLGESKRAVQTGTAMPVTEIDQEEIADRQAGTIAELIDSVPGVALVNGSTPQGSGINIRGFGANATFGTDQKVAVQVDGASVGAEELYRIGTQLYTDPFLFRSVEVIRGTVGSFAYGSGIVGGVVRLETKDASDFTMGEIGFAGSQTLEFTTNGDGIASSSTLAWQPTENLEFLANYTWRDQDLQDDGAGDVIGASDFTLPSYLLKGKYTFGAALDQSVSLTFTDTSSSDRDVPYDTFLTTADAFGNVDRDIDSRTAILTYGWNPGSELVDFTASLSYADQEIDSRYVPGSSPVEGTRGFPGLLRLVEADQRYKTTKLRFANTSLFETGFAAHELLTGIEFIRKDRRDASSAPGGRDDRVAFFAVDEIRLGDAWTITPALRFETSEIEGSTAPNDGTYESDALMGGVSLRRAFGNGFAVFGSAAYTENLPIIDDLNSVALVTTSEKARTYELGASWDRPDLFAGGDSLALKANLYQTTLYDVTSYSSSFGTQNDRPDEIETTGLEIEAAYALAGGFYVDLNANIADGEERDGGQSVRWRNTPADGLRATVGQRFGEALDLSWEVVASRAVDEDAQQAAGFAVHNLRATYVPQEGVLEGLEMRFGVENVFDRDYTPYLSTRPAPGRNVKLTLAKVF